MIKAVFLDFEGVITNNPMILHKDLFQKVKDKITFEEFDERYKPARIGKTKYKEFMKGFEEYEPNILSLVKFRPGAKEMLDQLKEKKIPLFLASNHIDGLAEKEVEILDISRYFKKMFFSHKMGLAKPSKEFFEEIKKQSGIELKEKEMLFVDDAKRNLETAKNLGFITVYVPNGIKGDTRNITDFKPDYEMHNVNEIINLIETINRKSK